MKVIYFILSLLAGLTVGVVIALFIAIVAFINNLIAFPFLIYRNCLEVERRKLYSVENDDIWERHIKRMKQKDHN
jgi:MFS superfamily sulfate permease-like transporter|tara:strand:+ start:240 stop:464 length:225 start_codon:yes stop_codon:yes gene_type:complete